jgi:TusE/DsrC/DsvC family sulfur relay protein
LLALSVDNDGYLVDPDEWTEDWARETARAANIELTAEHWEAIRFMRGYYDEHRIPADARFVIRHLTETLGADRNCLFELFPGGYPGHACRIAGMGRPRVWSTG